MVRILFINSVCGVGSTGRICTDLYDLATEKGYSCYIAYGRDKAPKQYHTVKIGNQFDVIRHVLYTRLFDKHGFGSKRATIEFLKWVEEFKPDIIHLHNIHGYYLNIKLLFNYFIKNPQIKIIWTLHDCWALTGHCAYFTHLNCSKWKTNCSKCIAKNDYPKSFYDNSVHNFKNKKALFNKLPNLTITTVSNWMNSVINESFLKDFPVITIKNGININNTQWDSKIIKKYNYLLSYNKKIILGVANIWDNRKGLDDFKQLAKEISNDFIIVLVGLNKHQIEDMPKNIIGIKRTDNPRELYYLYFIATVFFNPTKEESFGLTNMEAQLVGTPVISYDSGGTSETIINNNCFLIKNDISNVLPILKENQLKKINIDEIKLSLFDKNIYYKNYLKLYELLGGKK